MLNSNRNRRRYKRPTLWVPYSFHPENSLPPRLLPHCQNAYYLMHAIIVRVAFGDRDAARLKMQYLRNVIGVHNCGPIVRAMLESGDIRRVGNFVEGRHSFGYLPGEQYEQDLLRKFYPTDTRLVERLRRCEARLEEEAQPYRQPIHDVWQQWQTDLRIDTRLSGSGMDVSAASTNQNFHYFQLPSGN